VSPDGALSLNGGDSGKSEIACSKITWPELKCISIRTTCTDDSRHV